MSTTRNRISANTDSHTATMSESELRLARERLALERDMLALERERLAAERAQWEREREMLEVSSSGTRIGLGVFGISIAVALLFAGMLGFNAGLDTGRQQAPLPRHVVVSRTFLDLLARTQPLPPPADTISKISEFDWFALYKRSPEARFAGNTILVR